MKTLGIIGYGHFGKFLATQLSPHFSLKVYSVSGKSNEWSASFEEVASCDFLILSVPLTKHKEVCEQLKPVLHKNTVIVDVCSVKEESGQIIKHHLPGQPVLSTHPLFGPESAAASLKDHTIVICPDVTSENILKPCQEFCEKLGLRVVIMNSKEHDKTMALVQGLTFFVARVLKDFDLESTKLVTPSFRKLIALAELEQQHTKDLFVTIQKGNPHAEDVRQHFIDRAQTLQNLLAKEYIPE
jgi:prephenate dehydrogenase